MLNGYQEYHFDNGSLQMRGTFIYGRPKDSVVTFYRNGKTRESIIINPKIVVITEFDKQGNKFSIDHNQNKSFMSYWEYHHEEFFSNGSTKKRESSVRRIRRVEEFYADGQLKTKQTKNYRTEYYNDGLKKITYTWTRKRDHIMHSNDFTITKIEFDTLGKIIRKLIYEDWNFSFRQPVITPKRSDWIDSIEKYDGLNNVFSVKDMATKELIKKYPSELENDEGDNY